MAKSRRQRHRQKKLARTRQAAIESNSGVFVGDNCSPAAERAAREGSDLRNEENGDSDRQSSCRITQ